VLRDDPAHTSLPQLDPVVTTADVAAMQAVAEKIKFDESLVAYLLAIVHESRNHENLELGVSPRAAIALRRAAQARALVDGRDYCIPEDVRDLAVDVGHRMSSTLVPDESAAGDGVLREILERVPVPPKRRLRRWFRHRAAGRPAPAGFSAPSLSASQPSTLGTIAVPVLSLMLAFLILSV
jgi:MoxR-like ATPase